MKTTEELIKRIKGAKDPLTHRVFWDIFNHPEEYPKEWIKSYGIPYWESHKKLDADAQIIIDLYKYLLHSSI